MSMDYKQFFRWILCLAVIMPVSTVAAEATVAVASNFTAPANQLVEEFEAQSDHDVRLVFGSSGRFFAQISNGAPFDLFFSADQEKPQELIESGLAIDDSLFTYALGVLVLWSRYEQLIQTSPAVLSSNQFNRLAIDNARHAPYGVAAEAVLSNLNLLADLQSKLVRGENIAQTFQFVFTGNAELGFVAKSQVYQDNNLISGSAWQVTEDLHSPIRQDAVLLQRASTNDAALEFLSFVRSNRGRSIIESYGYVVGD